MQDRGAAGKTADRSAGEKGSSLDIGDAVEKRGSGENRPAWVYCGLGGPAGDSVREMRVVGLDGDLTGTLVREPRIRGKRFGHLTVCGSGGP